MASGLNLIPNPGVIVVVGILFWSSIAIIRAFFLAPYLALQEKRNRLTTGGQKDAEARLQEALLKAKELDQKLGLARQAAQKDKDTLVQDAQRKSADVIADAKAQAEAFTGSARAQIQKAFQAETERLKPKVDRLVDELFTSITQTTTR